MNLDALKAKLESQGHPPEPTRWCVDCRHWLPGAVILRGSTRGTCDLHRIPAQADDHCSDFARPTRGATP